MQNRHIFDANTTTICDTKICKIEKNRTNKTYKGQHQKTKEIINSFEDFQNDSEWIYEEYEDVDGFFTFNQINFKSILI